MGRPSAPLIEKSVAIAKALEIIDKYGIDALSVRRLGTELGVNGASLYHHFSDKEEILDGVRRLVLERIRAPTNDDVSWQDFVIEAALAFREALLRHPNTAPLMIANAEYPLGVHVREYAARSLINGGVPARYVYPIMDASESLAFGAAMINPNQLAPGERLGKYEQLPNLRRVVTSDRWNAEQRFRAQVEALVDGWTVRIELERRRRRPAGTQSRSAD